MREIPIRLTLAVDAFLVFLSLSIVSLFLPEYTDLAIIGGAMLMLRVAAGAYVLTYLLINWRWFYDAPLNQFSLIKM